MKFSGLYYVTHTHTHIGGLTKSVGEKCEGGGEKINTARAAACVFLQFEYFYCRV